MDLDFHHPSSLSPLRVYFPYYVTRRRRFWGRRIAFLPTWFLLEAQEHPDLAPDYLGGVNAEIHHQLVRRGHA